MGAIQARKSPPLKEKGLLLKIINSSGLIFGLRFFEADDAIAIFPLSTFAEQIDTLEAFENCAILFTAAAGGLETVVL
jgi:hypothetical protein